MSQKRGLWLKTNDCLRKRHLGGGQSGFTYAKHYKSLKIDRVVVMVGPDLSIPGHPEIFVIGDAASAMDKKGKPLPGLAPVAVQQGKYVAHVIRRRLALEQRPPFRYLDKGTMAIIGKTKTIATFGKLQFHGIIAWLGWCFVHILLSDRLPQSL